MEKKIKSLYITDNSAVLISVSAVWIGVIFVLMQVLSISPSRTYSFVAIGAGVSVLAAVTATSAALVMHLKKNKVALYTEEIGNSAGL